jgi:indole-3-glycerol phosphate synthase
MLPPSGRLMEAGEGLSACRAYPDGPTMRPFLRGEHVSTYLDDLVRAASDRVAAAHAQEPLDRLKERATTAPPGSGFATALGGPGVAVIAEVKRASPSKGPLAPDLDAVAQAAAYRDGGAAAISVLTEPEHFGGSLDDLDTVSGLGVPTLRKDFLVDPYQVWEARGAGAAAVLLIVAALEGSLLDDLLAEAAEAGLEALVEVHDVEEAARALDAGARIVGVNARDLHTFEVDRDAFARVRPTLPRDVLAVDESGISRADDVRRAALLGADAVLVGEALVRSADPRAAVALLVSAGSAPTTATEYR